MTDIAREVAERGLHSVRVVFADQHGVLRGKTVAASTLDDVLADGIRVPGSLLEKDTANTYVFDLWEPVGDPVLDRLLGARSITVRPDPATFRVLPWAEGTGLVLGDIETIDRDPIPHSTRAICRDALGRLAARGYRFRAGLELEFHLYRSRPGPSAGVEHSHPGWELLGEEGLDVIEPLVAPIREGLDALGMPARSIEVELGPSQVEMTFAPAVGIDVADQAVLVRTAIRSIARRHGHHATFMSRPAVGPSGRAGPDSFPSGWHLHQSLEDDSGSVFVPDSEQDLLSDVGRHYVAGLLDHAAASCLWTTPSVTGYKRYRPRAIAPDRVTWSREHRGAMLRIIGGPKDPGTRVENRAGDPAANPYLYVASQVLSGLDGIDRALAPPPPTESPYGPGEGERLPRTLGDAIAAFAASGLYRAALGDHVVDYFVALKRSEWSRYLGAVTDWEQREYFDLF